MSKRDDVINTARELFTKYGYKRVSMDDIAKSSNVTKKTIYTYFKDKETLFQFFITEELHNIKNIITETKNESIPFEEFVSKSVYRIIVYRNENLFLYNLIHDANDFEENARFLKRCDDEVIYFIENEIKGEISNNMIKIGNPHLAAFIIFKIAVSLLFEYDQELDQEKVTKEITSILKNGILS